MRKIEVINKVSRIDIVDNLVLIGSDSKVADGIMTANGDMLSIFQAGTKIKDYKLDFFYFLSFNQGVLFYEKEGEPICYFDFEDTEQITNRDTYFNPLQSRSDARSCIITEMDENFNKSHKLLDSTFNIIELPIFPNILLSENFICYNKSMVENYSISNLTLKWKLDIDPASQVERRNQRSAVFSDDKYVFIRLKGAKLQCVSLPEGAKLWELENDIKEVSFGEEGDFLYVHKGDGFVEVDKSTGVITKSLNYKDLKGLDGYSSNGIIWCFENIIVTRNSFTGELAVFNRDSFELMNREVVDTSGISESKDCIRFLDNYLYVLSTSSKLHIYDVGEEKPVT